jgi:CRP-like cAMP-binding protein
MGQRLFQQGDRGSSMFFVASGVGIVFLEDGEGRRTVVGELTAGQCVGELSLFRGELRATTVVASPAGVDVIEIGSDALEGVLRARPMLEDMIDDLVARRELEKRGNTWLL